MKKINISILLIGFLFFSSCEKNFEEYNTNPNRAEVVPASSILPNVIWKTADNKFDISWYYANVFSHNTAMIDYTDADEYKDDPGAFNNLWTDFYQECILGANDVIRRAQEADDNQNIQAVARLLRAFNFQIITDMWGDIPYSEAGLGFLPEDEGRILAPVYDSQQSVYADMINEVEEAYNQLSSGGGSLGDGDFIFNGSIDNWRKFAGSLLLKLHNRMSEVDLTGSNTGILDVITNYEIFESNSDDAVFTYVSGANTHSPIYRDALTRTDNSMSQTMVDLLVERLDPRIKAYAFPIGINEKMAGDEIQLAIENADIATDYVGHLNQTGVTSDQSQISLILGRMSEELAYPLITYSEVQFILAEYYARTSDDVSAKAAYDDAIQASFDFWGITMPAGYLALSNVDFDLATTLAEKQQLIIEQKYIALFLQGTETWSEYRRTGYPDRIVEGPESRYTGRGIATCLPYPDIESTTNADNIPGNDPDLYFKDLWWMQ